MRPLGNTFNYVNDTHIIDWLEQRGFDYDVITDCDIDRHGAQLLKAYDCVITPTHPEYYSLNKIEAFDAYQRGGGRTSISAGTASTGASPGTPPARTRWKSAAA